MYEAMNCDYHMIKEQKLFKEVEGLGEHRNARQRKVRFSDRKLFPLASPKSARS